MNIWFLTIFISLNKAGLLNLDFWGGVNPLGARPRFTSHDLKVFVVPKAFLKFSGPETEIRLPLCSGSPNDGWVRKIFSGVSGFMVGPRLPNNREVKPVDIPNSFFWRKILNIHYLEYPLDTSFNGWILNLFFPRHDLACIQPFNFQVFSCFFFQRIGEILGRSFHGSEPRITSCWVWGRLIFQGSFCLHWTGQIEVSCFFDDGLFFFAPHVSGGFMGGCEVDLGGQL